MATQQQDEQNSKDYEAAFNEPEAQKPDQTDDEAFGITPEINGDGQGDGEPPAVTIAGPEGSDAEEAAESPAEEAAEGPAGEAAEAEPEMTQNHKTWDGRLKKREEELNAREQAMKDKGAPDAEDQADGGKDEAVEDAGMSPDAAMAKLAEDFGPEFVQMIKVIASGIAETAAAKVATMTVETVDRDVKDIIAHLQDSGQKAHFKEIQGAHPDFMDVAASPEFEAWLKTRPEEEQSADADILSKGSAAQVTKLLDQYKAATGEAEDNGEDAAEGVRSGGITLPEQPKAGSNDYEKAWDEA